jgi:hypothetical protein
VPPRPSTKSRFPILNLSRRRLHVDASHSSGEAEAGGGGRRGQRQLLGAGLDRGLLAHVGRRLARAAGSMYQVLVGRLPSGRGGREVVVRRDGAGGRCGKAYPGDIDILGRNFRAAKRLGDVGERRKWGW